MKKDEMIKQLTEQFGGFVDKMYRIGEASLCEELLIFIEAADLEKESKEKIILFLSEKSKEFLNQ